MLHNKYLSIMNIFCNIFNNIHKNFICILLHIKPKQSTKVTKLDAIASLQENNIGYSQQLEQFITRIASTDPLDLFVTD